MNKETNLRNLSDPLNLRSNLRSFRCVVFDMDGTLTSTNTLIFHSFNRLAEEYLGSGSARKNYCIFWASGRRGSGEYVGCGAFVRGDGKYYAFYSDRHDEFATLHEGMKDVLKFLKQHGVARGLFTGKEGERLKFPSRNLG